MFLLFLLVLSAFGCSSSQEPKYKLPSLDTQMKLPMHFLPVNEVTYQNYLDKQGLSKDDIDFKMGIFQELKNKTKFEFLVDENSLQNYMSIIETPIIPLDKNNLQEFKLQAKMLITNQFPPHTKLIDKDIKMDRGENYHYGKCKFLVDVDANFSFCSIYSMGIGKRNLIFVIHHKKDDIDFEEMIKTVEEI